MRGLGGDDEISGWGGNGDDFLIGGGLYDDDGTIPDDDRLYGNGGQDTLTGTQGDDRLEGGSGDDTFLFDIDQEVDRVNTDDGNDVIADFGRGDDVIKIDIYSDFRGSGITGPDVFARLDANESGVLGDVLGGVADDADVRVESVTLDGEAAQSTIVKWTDLGFNDGTFTVFGVTDLAADDFV